MTMTALTSLPGPRFDGFGGQLRLGRAFTRDLLAAIRAWRAEYGPNFALHFGAEALPFVTEPADLQAVLVEHADDFGKSEEYTDATRGVRRFLGNGLLISDGAFWRRQRRLAAPAFHARRIETYADQMTTHGAAMLDRWADGARVDVSEAFSEVTFRIVAQALFGASVDAAGGGIRPADAVRVHRAVDVMQRYFADRQFLPAWVPTPMELRARRARRDLDAVVYALIAERRARGADDTGDLLSMLLAARDEDDQPMSAAQLRDEVVTLLLAGHETTANTLNWTMALLAQHPGLETRLHAEVDAVLDQGRRAPTLADLPNLPFTERVITEALRLYPAAFIIGRVAKRDVPLSFGVVPAGTQLSLPIYLVHRDSRWYPEPERFDPDRWLPGRLPDLPKQAYLPFGGGPRICIGNSFALMEARLLLAQIASRVRLRLLPETRLVARTGLTLTPRFGLPMRVVRRGG